MSKIKGRPFHDLCTDGFSSLFPSIGQDLASTRTCHSLSKTVHLFSLAVFGLVCPFHLFIFLSTYLQHLIIILIHARDCQESRVP